MKCIIVQRAAHFKPLRKIFAALARTAGNGYNNQSSPFFRALYLMMDQLPEVVVCVALIICGAWLVRGPKGRKQKPQNDAEDEDFTEYTAQDAQAEPEAKGFAMPKLSALLGKPVTPDDETEDADDGRDEK